MRDEPREIGDDLPQLSRTLLEGGFEYKEVLEFLARSEDLEFLWIECYPSALSVHQEVVLLPVKRATLGGEELEGARWARLYPDTQVIEIVHELGHTQHRSSPINLITQSPI